MKIGAIAFALSALIGLMASKTMSGCSSQQASQKSTTPEPEVTTRAGETPTQPQPSPAAPTPPSKAANPPPNEDYLPATKSGAFHPPQQQK